MITPNFPTRTEIAQAKEYCLARIEKKNTSNSMRDGLTYAAKMLQEANKFNPFVIAEEHEEIEEAAKIYKEQIAHIKSLKSIEARAIAIMCQDFINGIMSLEDFNQAINYEVQV